jgi:hypothetical protein
MKPIYKIILVSLIIVSYYQNKSINELKESANKIENINIILPKSSFGELEQIQKNHRAMVIAIAMTESNSSYSVKHPASDTVGIGGIKPSVWDLQCNINSLRAIDEVITHLEKQDKSPYEIIKAYKGAKINLKSTEQCWDFYQRLRGVL